MATPTADFKITRDVIARLVREQAPQLAHENLGAWYEGWDNVTVRLGEHHAVRLPRLRTSVPLAEVEHTWVPALAERMPIAVPTPVVVGRPVDAFPAPWSIVTWIEGADAGASPLDKHGLEDLGSALAALHIEAPAHAPVCPWRAGPLGERIAEVASRLDQLGAHVDAVAALAMCAHAAEIEQPSAVWIHSDIHARNLVVRDGRLAAIIDWGELSKGSRLIDLAQVWVLVGTDAFASVMDAYGGSIRPEETALWRGHAVDAATRLALSPDATHSEPAWRALAELGVARGA